MTRLDYLNETLNDFRELRDRANERASNLNFTAYEVGAHLFKPDDKLRLEEDVYYLNKRINEIIVEIREIEH